MTSDQVSKSICKGHAFDPGAVGSKCPSFMADYCVTNWNSCAIGPEETECESSAGQACDSYIRGGAGATTSVQQTISGYINDPDRIPIDYVSWALKKRADEIIESTDPTYTNPSFEYYKNFGVIEAPDGNFPNSGDPRDRDDSLDPFFVFSISYLCGSTENTDCIPPATGVCDEILGYFCQQFDRDDLIADNTLMKTCGCFLLPFGGTTQYLQPNTSWTCKEGGNCPSLDKDICCWRGVEGITPGDSPYYTDGNCDPVCINTDILNCDSVCPRTICIIDDVTINAINSGDGTVTLSQACGCSNCEDNQSGICYIGAVNAAGIQVQIDNVGIDSSVILSM